jgi:uncharacterized protein (DUF1810 family)
MERLYEIHAAGTYDLIVVDTPPTRNAIDFLEAPERMADFFSSRLLRCIEAILSVDGRSAREILGSPDDLKLRSSMTLFAAISDHGSPFHRAIEHFYEGKFDERTMEILSAGD